MIPIAIPFTARSLAEGGVFLAPKVVPGTPGFPLEVAFLLPSARSLSASGRVAASLMPRARHGSEAVDVDRGQLVYPSLKDVAIVMDLEELAPVDRRATSRRHRRRDEIGQPVAEDPVPGKTRRKRLTAGGIHEGAVRSGRRLPEVAAGCLKWPQVFNLRGVQAQRCSCAG